MDYFTNSLTQLPLLKKGKSRCINWENRTGEKGKGGMAESVLGPSRKGSPCIPKVAAGETVTLAEMEGPGVIQHIWVTVTDKTSEKNRYVLRDLVLRMYWDGEESPSVESPLGDFFCCGFGVSYPVNSMAIAVNPTRGFNCYFPMPFFQKAKITLENQGDEDVPAFFYQVDYCLTEELPAETGYFHAQWRRQRITEKGKDYVILDGVKGRGQYVGTYLALTALERYWYGEGEVKFYLDGDKEYPTICGTGTEDYFCGAWNFGTRTFHSLYAGCICIGPEKAGSRHALYRFHIADPIWFQQEFKMTIQALGWRTEGRFLPLQDDLSAVAIWYQSDPHAPLPPLPDRNGLEII